jgi:hypothetical protein
MLKNKTKDFLIDRLADKDDEITRLNIMIGDDSKLIMDLKDQVYGLQEMHDEKLQECTKMIGYGDELVKNNNSLHDDIDALKSVIVSQAKRIAKLEINNGE